MSSTSGARAWPLAVSEYSTRGGTSGKVWRTTMPSSSSARRRRERVRGLMPWSERSSSQKRARPSARSRITSIVHLPQMMSAVAQTRQFGALITSESSNASRSKAMGSTPRRRAPRASPGKPVSAAQLAEQAAPSAAGAALLRGRHAALAGLHEHPALALERHLDRLAGAAPDQVLQLHVG